MDLICSILSISITGTLQIRGAFRLETGTCKQCNMENTNYLSLHCNSLGQILKTKGIPHSKKRKEELVNLCESAEALKLPPINENDDFEASTSRRTVRGKPYPNPRDCTQLNWTQNLRTMPSIDAFDVAAYLQNCCGWTSARLERRKSDNSYKLHCSGHIHGVMMALLGT